MKLKPCPFCGYEVQLKKRLVDIGAGDVRWHYRIACEHSDCKVHVVVCADGEAGYPCNTPRTNEEAERLVVNAWNSRV